MTQQGAPDEVVGILQDLIRIDTTNTGVPETTVGEREAADYVAAKLREVGYAPTLVVHPDDPRRVNVVLRIPGENRDAPALLMHSHLDTVPAVAADWADDPHSGALRDGYVHGRGAVDMKNMVAMKVTLLRQWARAGTQPPRDVVVAFTADEEAGGVNGARLLVEEHGELFAGCTVGLSEVGGFSFTLPNGRRVYVVQSGEKGLGWGTLQATGEAGHGSLVHEHNVVTEVAGAVHRLGTHTFPIVLTPTMRAFLTAVATELEMEWDETDHSSVDAVIETTGQAAPWFRAAVRNIANPTMLRAGQKQNTVPSAATARIDTRALPGQEETFYDAVAELAGPGVKTEWNLRMPAWQNDFAGPAADAMTAAITAEDPDALVLPFVMPAGTDSKWFNQLGVASYGYTPMRLPDDLAFASLFHGKDERVPVDSVRFGVRTLDRFVAMYRP